MAAIFALSSQATPPGASLTPDWVQHGVAYAGLSLVSLRATAGGRWSGVGGGSVLLAWGIAVLYGVSDEWHQSFVPGRMADVRDVIADALGAALGLAAGWAWSIIKRPS
ncbi:MAG: VanZ family protein [Acidobacteria bacterium]|nr:VanZ family protein [Acidobacteriota bacterium]